MVIVNSKLVSYTIKRVLFVHNIKVAGDTVIFILIKVCQGSTWRLGMGGRGGGGALAERAAASHLDLNINIMANKIIPFP